MSFFDSYGLLNSREDEVNAENALLWTLEYIMMREQLSYCTQELNVILNSAIEKCKTEIPGIYEQNPDFAINPPKIPNDKFMSPDQLLAICGQSFRQNLDHHKLIWKQLKKQGYIRYDNVTPDSPKRWIHPQYALLIGIMNKNPLCSILIPIFGASCILSCLGKKESTSTKILSWVKCHLMIKHSKVTKIAFKICTKLITDKYGGWGEVFKIYFPKKNHPIHQFIDEYPIR